MSVQSPWLLLALGTAIVALIMLALWQLGIRNRNFSYVDVGWSANFAVLAAALWVVRNRLGRVQAQS